MKKVLVVLLILAVAGGAFAQELKFNGTVRGGLSVIFTNNDADDVVLRQWNTREGYNSRFQLTGAYTNAAGNAGFNTTLRWNNIMSGDPFDFSQAIPRAEAWFKILDGMIEIRGGYVDNETVFNTNGGWGSALGSGVGGLGMQFNVNPINGLNLRFVVAPGNSATSNSPGVAIWKASYRFGAVYTMADVFTASALFRHTYQTTDLGLGVRILALKSAGFSILGVDFGMENLGQKGASGSDFMTLHIGERIEWASGDLTIGGRFKQSFRLGGTGTYADKPDLTFSAFGQYVIKQIVPRLEVGFNIGQGIASNPRTGSYDAALGFNGYKKDTMNLSISPTVQFRLPDANSYIDLSYVLQAGFNPSGTKNNLRNTIAVNYGVNF